MIGLSCKLQLIGVSMKERIIKFEKLASSDLYVDAIYKGGKQGNLKDDVFTKLFVKTQNTGGFRKTLIDKSNQIAYVILYTSMSEVEWPDFLDEETGIFRYYGDNREPGRDILDTPRQGNKLLEEIFNKIHASEDMSNIPPFFIFKKTGNGRDVKFLGLAVPGNPSIPPDRDLISFWRSKNGSRFQNYEAYFTILNVNRIKREWIHALVFDHENNLLYAPKKWIKFISKGKEGIDALKAKKLKKIPGKIEQLKCDEAGNKCLEAIRKFCESNPSIFEQCAVDLVQKMDGNFKEFTITRPWRDGGRDAIGYYSIQAKGSLNPALRIECALEAKCYSEQTKVGVKQMSRLISRIRYRQFGIMVTTSYVDTQAYKEVIEDGHPILIITACDIAKILKANSIEPGESLDGWLNEMNNKYNENMRL